MFGIIKFILKLIVFLTLLLALYIGGVATLGLYVAVNDEGERIKKAFDNVSSQLSEENAPDNQQIQKSQDEAAIRELMAEAEKILANPPQSHSKEGSSDPAQKAILAATYKQYGEEMDICAGQLRAHAIKNGVTSEAQIGLYIYRNFNWGSECARQATCKKYAQQAGKTLQECLAAWQD